jgi:hypothetical protein
LTWLSTPLKRPIRHDSSNAFCAFRFSSLPGRNSRSLHNFLIPYHTILLFSPSSSDTDFIAYASPPTILYGLTLPHCIPSNIPIPPWSLSPYLSPLFTLHYLFYSHSLPHISLPYPWDGPPLFPFAILVSGCSFPVTFRAWTYRSSWYIAFFFFHYVYSALPLVPVSDLGFYLGSSLLCIIFALHWMRECMQRIGSFLNTIASDFGLRRYNSA